MPRGVETWFQCATPHKQGPADSSRLGAGRQGFAAPFMAFSAKRGGVSSTLKP
jgi:hypothetical protein